MHTWKLSSLCSPAEAAAAFLPPGSQGLGSKDEKLRFYLLVPAQVLPTQMFDSSSGEEGVQNLKQETLLLLMVGRLQLWCFLIWICLRTSLCFNSAQSSRCSQCRTGVWYVCRRVYIKERWWREMSVCSFLFLNPVFPDKRHERHTPFLSASHHTSHRTAHADHCLHTHTCNLRRTCDGAAVQAGAPAPHGLKGFCFVSQETLWSEF